MTRYLIAIPLPIEIADRLRQLFQETYHDRLRVRFMHTTLIPPFTVHSEDTLRFIKQKINEIPVWNTSFTFGSPGIFQNKHISHARRILYLPVNNSTNLDQAYTKILTDIRPHITIEASDFKKNQLPDFKAHVTLSYNFNGDPSLFVPQTQPFDLPQPEILQEAGPGMWNKIN